MVALVNPRWYGGRIRRNPFRWLLALREVTCSVLRNAAASSEYGVAKAGSDRDAYSFLFRWNHHQYGRRSDPPITVLTGCG